MSFGALQVVDLRVRAVLASNRWVLHDNPVIRDEIHRLREVSARLKEMLIKKDSG
jgi:hypothetical protein